MRASRTMATGSRIPLPIGTSWRYNTFLGRWRRVRQGGSAGAAVRVAEPGGPLPGARSEADRMPFDDSDRALVERLRAGDRNAFEILHRRYYARIYRFAFLRLGNAADAEDVAAETFCRALGSLPSFQFRRSASIYPWLHQIASNLVVDQIRGRPPGGCLSLDAQLAEQLDTFLELLPDREPSPQECVERAEVQALVRSAIDRLPADQARAIVLRFLGDLSIHEIALALDRSEGAVKSLLHRGLAGMRQHLKHAIQTARSAGPVQPSRGKAETHVQEMVRVRPGDPGA